MSRPTARLKRRIRRDFGREAEVIIALLADSPQSERVQAAAVLCAAGQIDTLLALLALADVDWRDTLMCTYETAYDLADEGWEARLDVALGPGAHRD